MVKHTEEELVQLVAENVLRACLVTTHSATQVAAIIAALVVVSKSCGVGSSDLHAALDEAIRLLEAS